MGPVLPGLLAIVLLIIGRNLEELNPLTFDEPSSNVSPKTSCCAEPPHIVADSISTSNKALYARSLRLLPKTPNKALSRVWNLPFCCSNIGKLSNLENRSLIDGHLLIQPDYSSSLCRLPTDIEPIYHICKRILLHPGWFAGDGTGYPPDEWNPVGSEIALVSLRLISNYFQFVEPRVRPQP